MCSACDAEEMAQDERWPEVIGLALEEMQLSGAPTSLLQPVMTAMEPLSVWWQAGEEARQVARVERRAASQEAARVAEDKAWKRKLADRVWAPSDPEGWAARHADEAAWAEHL